MINNIIHEIHGELQNGRTLAVNKIMLSKTTIVNNKDQEGRSALHHACSAGLSKVAEVLLQHGASVNLKDKDGQSALHHTCIAGYSMVAEVLLQHGADANLLDKEGKAPLHLACSHNSGDALSLMTENSSYFHIQDNVNKTALWSASLSDHVEVVSFLLEQGADVNVKDNEGKTALWAASSAGHVKALSLLLKPPSGAKFSDFQVKRPFWVNYLKCHLSDLQLVFDHDINKQDSEGRTALWVASFLGDAKVVKFLLQHGADIHKKDNFKTTPLWAACLNGKTDIAKLLLCEAAMKSGLQPHQPDTYRVDTSKCDPLCLSEEIEQANTDTCLLETLKPLVAAAGNGHVTVVSTLMDHGADVNLSDDSGMTALHYAAQKGHDDVVEVLIAGGSKVNSFSKSGWTPLHYAAREGHNNIVKALIAKGAMIDGYCTSGMTPLCHAFSRRHESVVRLPRASALSLRNKNGSNALYVASEQGHVAVVDLLLKNGANVNHQNRDGNTALYVASVHGHEVVVDLLLQHGADINHQDRDGNTILHVASMHGHVAVVNLLLQNGAGPLSTVVAAGRRNEHPAIVLLALTSVPKVSRRATVDRNTTVFKEKPGTSTKHGMKEVAEIVDFSIDKTEHIYRMSRDGDTEGASAILSSKIINNVDQHGLLAHNFAFRHEFAHLVHHNLLQRGAYSNIQDVEKRTPLWAASLSGYTDVVSLLLNDGEDAMVQDDDGTTALWAACLAGHTEIVKLLLKATKGNICNVKDRYGWGPLFVAASIGHVDIVKMLLEADRSDFSNFQCLPNKKDGESQIGKSLYTAAQKGKSCVVETLLEYKERFDLSLDMVDLLQKSVEAGHDNVVKTIIAMGTLKSDLDSQETPPEAASREKEPHVLKDLLELASRKGDSRVVRELLVAADDKGFTYGSALNLAVEAGHVDVVGLFLQHGARPETPVPVLMKSETRKSSLHIALERGHTAVIRMVLNYIIADQLAATV